MEVGKCLDGVVAVFDDVVEVAIAIADREMQTS